MNIIYFPNKKLRSISKKIKLKEFNNYNHVIVYMKKNLIGNNIAISAIQIGFRIRVFLVKKSFLKHYLFINPIIIWRGKKKKKSYEGCISIPNYYRNIKRYKTIIVEYFCKNKSYNRIFIKGFISFCIQHEMDHLNGILIKV
ncbi:peptide deformylase [Candidatus Vidania fulgoroideorum]